MAQPVEPSSLETVLIVAGVVVLPVVFVAAGLLLLMGAKWVRAKACAIAVVGVVALPAYAVMAVNAWLDGRSAWAVAAYVLLGVVWLLFGLFQYKVKKKVPQQAD